MQPEQKIQPWRVNWPVAPKEVKGIEYACKSGDIIIRDGTGAGTAGTALINQTPVSICLRGGSRWQTDLYL